MFPIPTHYLRHTADLRIEMEQLEEKNRSLQRLNQTLSANMNVARKELSDMRNELERESLESREKIRALQTEIELLRNESAPS